LENLSLGPQGASFELDGRPIRLDSGGYAAPVASLQEFYHQALADFYQRSAEITRQQAAARPPLLGRLFSWIGGLFGRRPDSAPPAADLRAASPQIISPPQRNDPRPASPASPMAAPEASSSPKPVSPQPAISFPVLHLVFADQNGVHVIWQLTPTKHGTNRPAQERGDAKAATPRFELTYNLDSPMAQRLQDCYGQLAQLGYKIAGLEAVRAAPERPAAKKEPSNPALEAPSVASKSVKAEKSAIEAIQAAEPKSSPRKPRLDANPVRAEPDKANPEPPSRDPSLLPGI
jgi:hypothetical protein